MNVNLKKGSIIIIIIVVLGGVVYFTDQSKEVNESMNENNRIKNEEVEQDGVGAMMEKDGDEAMKSDSMMEKGGGEMMNSGMNAMKFSGSILAGRSSPLIDFTKTDYDVALKSNKLIVLYFYANWCPTCRAEFPVMQKAFNNISSDDVIGFRVNYNDNETDNDEKNLAKQFGVAYQHTKVFVRNGERILKSPETWDERRYESEISKASK